MKLIKEEPFHYREHNQIIRKIGEFRSWKIIDPLKKLSNTEGVSDQLKQKILEELGRLGDPRIISFLGDFIHYENKNVRNAAVKGLSRFKNSKCIEEA